MGIKQELQPHVFDLFTQHDRGLDRTEGGLGIGLAMVKKLVEIHAGTISASSDGDGTGSEFTVTLPTSETDKLEKESAAGVVAKHRILIVDDNMDSAETMSLFLSLDGYETKVAYDGPEAISIAEGFNPNILILDIGLPGMDGYELARYLRNVVSTRDALMMALTGYGRDEDRARSRSAGFDHHFVKPVDPNELRALLSNTKAR